MIILDKVLADKITKDGMDNIIHFCASSYRVSDESIKAYIKIHDKYPLVYAKMDNENEIIKELINIERFLKIRKLNKNKLKTKML